MQITRDRSAFSLIGPTATPQQVVNAQITTCIYQCWSRLEQLKEEHSDAVFAMLRPGIQVGFRCVLAMCILKRLQ